MADNDTPRPPPNSKGKGKAAPLAADDVASGSATADRPSVLSRIVRSAAGLGRDAVAGRPQGADLAGLVSTDKAGSSGRPAHYSAELQSSYPGQASRAGVPPTAALAAGVTGVTGAPLSTGFTSPHTREHIAAQEDAFSQFLAGADIDMSIPQHLPGMEEDISFPTFPTDTATAAVTETSAAPSAAVAEQQSRDGLDVILLLDGATTEADEPDYLHDMEMAEDELAGLQQALFGSSQPAPTATTATTTTTSARPPWDNVLNFIPDFARPAQPGVNTAYDVDSRAVLGIARTPETARLWLDQWRDVLTRYDEEVWGGLAPLVAEAREEVEQLAAAPPESVPGNTKALGRLQQILGHLRGSL